MNFIDFWINNHFYHFIDREWKYQENNITRYNDIHMIN